MISMNVHNVKNVIFEKPQTIMNSLYIRRLIVEDKVGKKLEIVLFADESKNDLLLSSEGKK